MDTSISIRRRVPETETHSDSPRRRLGHVLAVLLAWTCILPGPALAIPSPDVMVNLFASTAQVLGLVSILLGRWFFVRRKAPDRTRTSTRAPRLALAVSLGLCAAASVGWYLYYASVRDERLERLQVNLNRNSREEGKKIVDVSLKELSFSDQQQREDGLQTEELARELAGEGDLYVLDVRESEEFEVGAVDRARHVRFPDLSADPARYLDKSRTTTLLCFNGNRSSELAEHLRGLGYDCRFLVGGYEKWLAEDRPLAGEQDRERADLREVPDYPNKTELLDTPDVMRLAEERDVLFVDVRYPADFETLGHLPGAVNIPMRKLTTTELDQRIAGLPKGRPVVVPSYDKRSSFFGLVIGLRLSRAGYEYLGRYTVPEGFSAPGKDKPHVAAWRAAHAPRSLLTLAADPLLGTLEWLRDHLGSLALAVLALVGILRLAILPLTWKSERDRRVQRELEPEIARLKATSDIDPSAFASATAELWKRHGVRPFLNFVTAVVQLLLFTVFFGVVQRAATGSTESFLGIAELGRPDSWRLLPFAIGALLVAQVLQSARRPYRRWVLALTALASACLVALTWSLAAAVNLYLVASLAWLVAQTAIVGFVLARRATRAERAHARVIARYEDASVVPLRHAHQVAGTGNKAVRLGRLMELGFNVPDGFVVRAEAVRARSADGRFTPGAAREILRAIAELKADRVAVRSSGLNEDGADRSYAGVFDSILDVEKDSLFEALDRVANSLSSSRTAAYSGEHEVGGIVVQAMVPASFAGVYFTEHPAEAGTAVVELVSGLGDALVSGRAQPQSFRLGRFSGRPLDARSAPIDLAPLFEIGTRAEAAFGRPQDMEWAFADGRIHVLQSRDITCRSTDGESERSRRESERARVLEFARGARPDEVVLAQNELSELLPRPRPFSLAFLESLFAFGGSTHRAMQNLGIPYDVRPDSPSYVVGVFGALYVNKHEERRRSRRGASSLASFRLVRAADEMERAWREDFLPSALRAMRRNEALDLARFDLNELVLIFRESRADFVERIYVHAEEINIAADFYLKTALRAIEKRGIDAADELSRIPTTVVHTAFERLANGDTPGFLEQYGHRAALDYEFSAPRFAEDPALVQEMAARARRARHESAPAIQRSGVLGLCIDRARRWQALKEEAKHHALRDLAHLRRLVVAIGERTGLDDAVFDLTPEEVARLDDAVFREQVAPALASRRLDERLAHEFLRLPSQLSLSDLEALDLEHGGLVPHAPREGALRGTRVSGQGGVIGRARVLREPEELDSFRENEILVARFTDPTWMPIFPLAAGIVTEVGGWLSHAAIQAREHGLTAIVGVEGALDVIETGDLLVLAGDGTVVRQDERRVEPRVAFGRDVRVIRRTGALAGRLLDLSANGAQLAVQGALEIGEELEIEGNWKGEPDTSIGACVSRNGTPGVYGLRWRQAVDPVAVVGTPAS